MVKAIIFICCKVSLVSTSTQYLNTMILQTFLFLCLTSLILLKLKIANTKVLKLSTTSVLHNWYCSFIRLVLEFQLAGTAV